MKKMTALLISTLIATPAFAADVGGYLGINLGNGKLGIPAPAGTTFAKTSSTVYGGTLGYQMDRNWAVEAQYTGIGTVQDAAGNQSKGTAVNFAMLGTLPVSENFSLYGKVGLANSKTTSNAKLGVNGASRTGLSYGVGAQVELTSAMSLRAGWDRYPVATNNAAGAKLNSNTDVLGAGLIVRF